MRLRVRASTLAAAAWAALLGCSSGAIAHAQSPAADSSRVLRVTTEGLGPDDLRLGLAAMEQSLGNLPGVVRRLEGIDYSAGPTFPEADRAAFLLGEAYLGLGNRSRFLDLAYQVARWQRPTPYTRWIAYRRLLIEAGDEAHPPRADSSAAPAVSPAEGVGAEAANALAAAILIKRGEGAAAGRLLAGAASSSPLAAQLRWLVAFEADSVEALSALAASDTSTRLGRDLAGGARVRLATRELERGGDPTPLLEAVPTTSSYYSTARHMLGLSALERGDSARGAAVLETLLADDSTYAARREVALALAGQALDQARWEAAEKRYRWIDQDWTRAHDRIQGLSAPDSLERLWADWGAYPGLHETLALDALPAGEVAGRLAAASADLTQRPALELPALDAPAAAGTSFVPPPPPEAWEELAALDHRRAGTLGELTRTRAEAALERERLEDLGRYLGAGRDRTRLEASILRDRKALLDSLKATVEALDQRLRAVRDAEGHRVAQRTAWILETCAGDLLWIEGMRRFHVDGPDPERATAAPQGFFGPQVLLNEEEALVRAIRSAVEGLAAAAPGILRRSYEQAWGPSLIGRVFTQSAEAARALAMARALEASIDSGLVAAGSSPELRRLDRRALALGRTADSLEAASLALRKRLAREAVGRALAALEGEREAIDYGLAASAYALSVKLSPHDSAGTRVAVAGGPVRPAAPDTSGAAGEEAEDPEAAAWRAQAIPMIRTFLARHGASPARGEMRFRLADLELVEARQRFREQMAAFVKSPAAGRGASLPVPVLRHAASLDLYRRILAEDRDFPHLDAVRFDAGMILADEGDPEAERFFRELVTLHPQSPYCQEAYLRMGDMRFDETHLKESIELYARAAEGADPSLATIAWYKRGWAEFNQDRFLEAADAFRSVLDLYGSPARDRIQVDIENEANAYLVHSLAGAGGAAAFSAYFDRIGKRPYERRLLISLGQHYRRYEDYPQAVAVDELFLQRYPLEADALVSAQRLVETHRRSNRPASEREAQLALAPRFAPGSEWSKAQASDSARAEGAAFAKSSWKAVAFEYHRKARTGGSREDWKQALALYERLLSHWPDDAEAPSLELEAGEASALTGDPAAALAHYERAAAIGADSIATQALWQRVAVTDAWYQSTRTGAPALGRDSLARAVLTEGDRLLARFPDHPRGADIVWRQGQLALAHGWNERAVDDLGRMVTRHPDDRRAPLAANQRGEALFRLGRFEEAGAAFEAALVSARQFKNDSLARRAAQAIPVCYYRGAEAAVAADSTAYERHATLFEQVATRWPEYPHAHLALYRAGLAYERAGKPRESIRVLQALIARFPRSEYVRDARLAIARTWEATGDREAAAAAYLEFSDRHPDDEGAGTALLKAADLLAAAGQEPRADDLRLAYIRKHPEDVESAMEILEAMARRELAALGPQRPVSSLLPAVEAKPAKGKKRAKTQAPPPAPASHLAAYMRLCAAHPRLASRPLLAQVSFLRAEEAQPAYVAARLGQPLAKSIPVRQRLLDTLLVRYRRCVDLGVPEWAHASAFRIGEALIGFGEALEQSERPKDLAGDDLRGYEDVLYEQSRPFRDRGETVWSELLDHAGPSTEDDRWMTLARDQLWRQISPRFAYRPEVDYPVIDLASPPKPREEKGKAERPRVSAKAPRGNRASLEAEGGKR